MSFMANQYVAQMTEEVQAAVFGNVGSLISFQIGIDDAKSEKSFKVYPNPAKNHLTIEWDANSLFNNLIIANQLGQTMLKQVVSNSHLINLNTGDWPKGVYIIRLENKSDTQTRKVVIY